MNDIPDPIPSPPGHIMSRAGILVGSILILVGGTVMLAPLLPFWVRSDGDLALHLASYTVFYWFGLLLLLAGITSLITSLIPFDATGAGNLKIGSFELPVQITGAAFLLFFLILGGAYATNVYGLDEVQDRYRRTAESLKIEQEFPILKARHDAYQGILEARITTGLALLKMRVECPDGGIHWIKWSEELNENGVFEGVKWTDGSDTTPITVSRGVGFQLQTALGDPIIRTELDLIGDDLVATIRPMRVSLFDYCGRLAEEVDAPTVTTVDAAPNNPDLTRQAAEIGANQ
ncbi:hypothetical protein [Yoonia sp. I 8.24]|uniref:hypothetical protein n=1 Tax=Yoonia sp. I 8.24 TaxID=1537229 RepID=UPI001EDE85AA|nr:hypothetical protein [Yoonia sp. I 8.24]MCG3266694.1 hypothetical protein [Yoonia sp. I 8.24]